MTHHQHTEHKVLCFSGFLKVMHACVLYFHNVLDAGSIQNTTADSWHEMNGEGVERCPAVIVNVWGVSMLSMSRLRPRS